MASAAVLTNRDKRIFEHVRSAKSWIDNAISDAIHFQHGHSTVLQAVNRYLETDWFKQVPTYRKYEVRGYKEALLSSRWSPLHQHQRTALLYQSKLYIGFDEWRSKHPDTPGSALQDSNVVVWKCGKIYYAGPNNKDLENVTYEWATPKE